jgi:prephenate dehydrogenase
MQRLPPGVIPIGGHPMCGKETGGIQNADPALFEGRPFVLCPLERTSPAALALVHALVAAIGAYPLRVDAARHDVLAALVSHLPYAAAVALMRAALHENDDLAWQMAASGFRDTTRLAASDLRMMVDILLTNREAILETLDSFQGELNSLRAAIGSGDADRLHQTLEAAQARRARMFPSGPEGEARRPKS